MDSLNKMRLCSEMRLPISTMPNVAKAMKPSPPTWIRHSSTICPKRLRSRPASIRERPVTHTADVAVNIPFKRPRDVPSALAAGSVNSSPPAKISAKNPRQSARPGDNVLRLSGLRRSEKTVSSLKAVVPFVLFPKKSRIKAFFIISRKSKFV